MVCRVRYGRRGIINRICGDELDRTKGRILRKLEGKGERIK